MSTADLAYTETEEQRIELTRHEVASIASTILFFIRQQIGGETAILTSRSFQEHACNARFRSSYCYLKFQSFCITGLSFCATRIWKLGGLCVVGSTRLLVKMIVVPGAMIVFALATNSDDNPLFCAVKNKLSLAPSVPAAVTSIQRTCPCASVP